MKRYSFLSPAGAIFQFAWTPLTVALAGQIAFLIEVFFVGKALGIAGTAAFTSVSFILSVAMAYSVGLSIGVKAATIKCDAVGSLHPAEQVLSAGIVLAVPALFFAAVLSLFSSPLAHMLLREETAAQLLGAYLQVAAWCIIPQTVSSVLQSFLKGKAAPRTLLLPSVAMNSLKIILLIAYSESQIISTSIGILGFAVIALACQTGHALLIFFVARKNGYSFTFNKDAVRLVWGLAVPSSVLQLGLTASGLLLLKICNALPPIELLLFTVLWRFSGEWAIVGRCVSEGAGVLSARSHRAGHNEQSFQLVKTGVLINAVIYLLVVLAGMVLPRQFEMLIGMQAYGEGIGWAIPLAAIALMLDTMGLVYLSTLLSLGDSSASMRLLLISQLLIVPIAVFFVVSVWPSTSAVWMYLIVHKAIFLTTVLRRRSFSLLAI